MYDMERLEVIDFSINEQTDHPLLFEFVRILYLFRSISQKPSIIFLYYMQ